MTRRKTLLLILAVLALGACGHRTPPGQPPLAELSSLNPVQTEFNHASGEVRIILLLSPT